MKTNNGKKSPKETGTWYKSLIEGKTKAEYYRHFIKKINDITTEYFGQDETKRTLKAIESGKIRVPNIETFLFDHTDISDASIELYNTCSSLDEFITKSIINFKKRAETGESEIPIREFFLVLSDLVQEKSLYPSCVVKDILKGIITSLITVSKKSPYNFIMLAPEWIQDLGKQFNLNTKRYRPILKILLEVLQDLMKDVKDLRAYIPQIKILYPVYYDTRENQISYLAGHFSLMDRIGVVRSTLEDVPNLSIDTPQLRSRLEYLRSRSGGSHKLIEPVIFKLQEIEQASYLKRYPTKNSLSKVLKDSLPKNYYNNFNVEPIFADKELFQKCLKPYFCNVEIDCSNIKKENLESFIDVAKTLNLVKGYYNKTKRDLDTLTFKITLINVKQPTKEFQDFINNKMVRLCSLTNKNFIIEVLYDNTTITQRVPEDLVTHFCIISDIHADYNQQNNYQFHFGNDFVINCGDTAGDAVTAGHWMFNYMRKGVTVVGNHLGYSSAHPERDGIINMERWGHTRHPSSTKREQIKELFNLLDNNQIVLLSNTCTEYKGVYIIGTCLYTDFNLYGEKNREECMNYAKKYMNDFKFPVVMDNTYYVLEKDEKWDIRNRKISESKIRPFAPSDHAAYFQYSFGYIKQTVEEHKNKPIIIVTHHAPSPYSISEQYKGSLLNAAFASNLNQYIVEHPEIRLWAHGHVHTPFDYILGETRIVCCPFGYNNENNFNLPYEYGLRIPIEEIKSRKSWKKILANRISAGEIKVYDR